MPWQKQRVNKLKLLVVFCFLGISLSFGWLYYLAHAKNTLPNKPYEFSVESGSSLKKVSIKLAEDHLIPNAWLFLLLSKITKQETTIKAGDYSLNEDLSPLQLL